jgi:hypothetical protein
MQEKDGNPRRAASLFEVPSKNLCHGWDTKKEGRRVEEAEVV